MLIMCVMDSLTESEVLASHDFVVVKDPEYDEFVKESANSKLFSCKVLYSCKVCQYEALGTSKGPTVWSSFVMSNREKLSCNDVVVKDIIE